MGFTVVSIFSKVTSKLYLHKNFQMKIFEGMFKLKALYFPLIFVYEQKN